ncbi:hypothetical protein H8958_018524 [Nasalis larvatus]
MCSLTTSPYGDVVSALCCGYFRTSLVSLKELDGKPASPTPVIVASHTANKEEKSLLELEVDLDNLELEDIDTTDINLDEDILDD